MCRFDSDGEGFNEGMTRREPGDVIGTPGPMFGGLGRDIVRERGVCDIVMASQSLLFGYAQMYEEVIMA